MWTPSIIHQLRVSPETVSQPYKLGVVSPSHDRRDSRDLARKSDRVEDEYLYDGIPVVEENAYPIGRMDFSSSWTPLTQKTAF